MEKRKIYMIVGPTGVGKTKVAINVAKKMNPQAEIVSADSIQIYKKLDIGSAKPTQKEMQNVLHHLIDEIEIDAPQYSVAQFQKRAIEAIDTIFSKNKTPLIVGGTGLYINSLLFPMEFSLAKNDESFRKKMFEIQQQNPGEIHQMLQKVDPVSAKRIHQNDAKRVVRALEVFETTGKTITYFNEQNAKKEPLFCSKIVGLTMPREKIYARIENRVDEMIQNGLVQEVENILKQNVDITASSLQGLGYKEIIEALQGKITINEAVDKIKIETRHFAKRQFTWFKRNKNILWVEATQTQEKIENEIIDFFYS